MKENRITVEIDEQGRITADAAGFEGETCLAELDKLLGGLAATTSAVKKKPEAFRHRVTTRAPDRAKLGRKP